MEKESEVLVKIERSVRLCKNGLTYIYFQFKPNCTKPLDGLWLGATDISTTDERTFIWEKSGKVRLG
jgi:hypothetical protein